MENGHRGHCQLSGLVLRWYILSIGTQGWVHSMTLLACHIPIVNRYSVGALEWESMCCSALNMGWRQNRQFACGDMAQEEWSKQRQQNLGMQDLSRIWKHNHSDIFWCERKYGCQLKNQIQTEAHEDLRTKISIMIESKEEGYCVRKGSLSCIRWSANHCGRAHPCLFCFSKFDDNHQLERHVRVQHSKEEKLKFYMFSKHHPHALRRTQLKVHQGKYGF